MRTVFRNRRDAGRRLALEVRERCTEPDVLVLALPRGGVPVAFEVARALDAPLDVFLVRKLGTPGQEELAMGAIASGGVQVLNESVVRMLHIPQASINEAVEREQRELARREQEYRQGRPAPEVKERTVVLVDDGLATGASMHAAIKALRQLGPARILVAVPTGAADTCESLRGEVDDLICLDTPEPFFAVGGSYADFSQTTDAEVGELLQQAAAAHSAQA